MSRISPIEFDSKAYLKKISDSLLYVEISTFSVLRNNKRIRFAGTTLVETFRGKNR